MSLFHRLLGYALVAVALAMTGTGIAMFWGPPRQVVVAPLVVVIGGVAYGLARTLQYVWREEGR